MTHRRLKKRCGILVALMVMAIGAGGVARADSARPLSEDMEELIRSNATFACDLYAALRTRKSNLCFSPHSIFMALTAVHAGARGETQRQIAQALHLNSEGRRLRAALGRLVEYISSRPGMPKYRVERAHALWLQSGIEINPEFRMAVRGDYRVALHYTDFTENIEAARNVINAWARRQTEWKFKNFVPPELLPPATRFLVADGIYFKGEWAFTFDERETKEMPFLTLNGEEVVVPVMHKTAQFRYASDDRCQIVELPYADYLISMLILLPHAHEKWDALEEALTRENLEKWISALSLENVDLLLPRFRSNSLMRLDDTLKLMGVTEAFSEKADFSGVAGPRNISLGPVLHKPYLEVDEKGSLELKAYQLGIGVTVTKGGGVAFQATRPFIFLIRDNQSGIVLFLGRMINPTEGREDNP